MGQLQVLDCKLDIDGSSNASLEIVRRSAYSILDRMSMISEATSLGASTTILRTIAIVLRAARSLPQTTRALQRSCRSHGCPVPESK